MSVSSPTAHTPSSHADMSTGTLSEKSMSSHATA
jgi:hypothetical protein